MRKNLNIRISGYIIVGFVLAAVIVLLFFFFRAGAKKHESFSKRVERAYEIMDDSIFAEIEFRWLVLSDNIMQRDKNVSTVGWVSDIHADRFKRRTVDSGTLYPLEYSEYLPKVFNALRKKGITTVVATGDNVNAGDEGYSYELLKIAHRKNMKMIWVKGNHDSEKSMEVLDSKQGNHYSFVDIGETRLIVLDNTKEGYDAYIEGGIDQQQLDWLSEALKTEKKKLVAMHIPIFSVDGNVLSQYLDLERIMHEGGVEAVFSGHLHIRYAENLNGIGYYGESALTRENEKGGFGIINIQNMSVDYEYAK